MRGDVVRDLLLLVLAACGGGMDAIAYLRLHAFIANVTGDTVLLGLGLGGRRFEALSHPATALATFALGAFVAAALGGKTDRNDPWPKQLAVPFAIEVTAI